MSRLIVSALMLSGIASNVLYAAPKSAGASKSAAAAPVIENGKPAPENGTAVAIERAAYAIEDNIPLPSRRVAAKGESIYPYAKLEVGQSFFVPVSDQLKEPWKTVTSLSSRMTRELWPKTFVTARQAATATQPEGVRVWRATDGEGELPAPKPRAKKGKAADGAENAVQQPSVQQPNPEGGAPQPTTGAPDPFAGTQQAA